MWKRIGENKFEEAWKLACRSRNIQGQIGVLVSIVQSAQNAGKMELVRPLLDEAWALANVPVEQAYQFKAQLQIAGASLRINPTRSFEILEASLNQFNELFAATAAIESFESRGNFRKKEMILQESSRMIHYLEFYLQQLPALSALDPERVQSLIERF